MQAVSDEQLIEWVAAGDASCLGTLFERHHVALFNYCLQLTRDRALAEDIVQDVYLKLLSKAGSFRGDASFKSWLFGIARNLTFDLLRKQQRQKTDTDADAAIAAQLIDERSAERRAAGTENVELVAASLAALPAAQRDIIWLARFEFADYRSLAVALGCTPATARVRMHRAMQALSEMFTHRNGVPVDV